MTRIVTIQPATGPDHKQPHPFHILDDCSVGRQDVWRGTPGRLIGFTNRWDTGNVTLLAEDWLEGDPDAAISMYPVFSHSDGTFNTYKPSIASVIQSELRDL